MRSRTRVARLVGWVRLLPNEDGYGVPVFQGRGNARLIPETDDDLVITSFDEFYNEASYDISTMLPRLDGKLRYRLGDKVPIPLCIGGVIEIVDAGQSVGAFLSAHSKVQAAPTILAVAGILNSVASGAYRAATARRIITRLRLEHDEVLSGEPAHSAYWVQKLGQAVAAVKRMPKADQLPGRGVVAERATAWLRRFGSKSDPQMLGRLLKVAAEGGAAKNAEMQGIVFSILLSRFGGGTLRGREADRMLTLTRPWMPAGLYGHYLLHGVPEGLRDQDRERARDLPRFLMKVIGEEDHGQASFARSLALAGALFSDRELPVDISDTIGRMASNKAEALSESLKWAYGLPGSGNRTPNSDEAAQLLLDNHSVVAMYRILHGEDRLSYDPGRSQLRYGLAARDIELLHQAAKAPDSLQEAARINRRSKRRKRQR